MSEVPNLTELYEELNKKAISGKHPETWFPLGNAYLYGMGTEQDIQEALNCFRNGHRVAGDIDCCYAIYDMWTSGVSLITFEDAMEMCFKAARHGHKKAVVAIEREKQQAEAAQPQFKYHPNAYVDGETFVKSRYYSDPDGYIHKQDGNAVCQCCNRETEYYHDSNMYCTEDVDCVCPECIASGKAAERFDGSFVAGAEKAVTDQEKIDELFKRTPGYMCCVQEYWLACCDDYCAFIGETNLGELERLGVLEETLADCEAHDGSCGCTAEKIIRNGLVIDIEIYLFKCLHCGKYRIWMDRD